MVGTQVYAPHHTRVCKISWLWEALSSLVFNNFKLSNFTNLKALFSGVSKNFPPLVHVKSWKKPWKALYQWNFLFFCWSVIHHRPTHPAKKDCNPLIIIMCYLFSWNSPWPGHFGDHCWLSRWCPWIGCVDGKDRPSDKARSQIMPCKPFDNLGWIWYK